MSWRDQLRAASFRGVPFLYAETGGESGRRVVVHEYPLRELPETEDLGARAEQLGIRAYVIGDDYIAARDALEDALNQPGPGELVHPYRGTMMVAILSVRLEESTREGGMARFEIDAIRASAVTRPSVTTDTRNATAAAADAATQAAGADFVAHYSPARGPSLANAIAAVDSALSAVSQAVGVAELSGAALAAIVNKPLDIEAQIRGLIARIDRIASLRGLFTYSAPAANGAGIPGNGNALQAVVQAEAVIRAAALSAATDYSSYDAAIAARDELTDAIDRIALTADDEHYAALQVLRTAVAADLLARSADLARITTFTPDATLPALVIAQRLYGPADVAARADDLCARNSVAHPGFVPGQVSLEVLSD